MRIGVIWHPGLSAANYRARDPVREMERRGHTVVWPASADGWLPAGALLSCDLVHAYRRYDDQSLRTFTQLKRSGIGLTWDNDDDLSVLPKGTPNYDVAGGRAGQRIVREMMKAARMADVVTTTTPVLAERLRSAGLARVEVVENCVAEQMSRPRHRRGRGVVIGWVAGLEHHVDAKRLGIRDAVEQLLEARPEVRVQTIGVDLALAHDRYEHLGVLVPFTRLPYHVARFDIGIAPLADLPFNRARSDIKLKEYAACGVPWLASPVGPYASLGESEGGRLVRDGEWFDAMRSLVEDRRARRRLGRQARAWGKRSRIAHVADRWEAIFREAASTRAAGAVD